ncbi:hypothetical protein M2322_004790 [Rhodoblastus acidophilus]|nr:hypothetical protein [Rhodoblastus acidophilus]
MWSTPSSRTLTPNGVKENKGIKRLQRSVLPFRDLVEHGVGYRADEIGRNLDAVKLAQMALDLAHAHVARVHRHDLRVEAWEAPLVFGDQLRVEGRQPVARDRDVDLAGVRQHGLVPVTVAAIRPAVLFALVKVVVDLPIQRPFGERLLQFVEKTIFRKGLSGSAPARSWSSS